MALLEDDFDEALQRYRRGVFTDADVTACAGLSGRSIRQLLKVGAVQTVSGERGAGHIRKFDSKTLKRLVLVSALNRAGLSLTLAGQMAYLLPDDDHLYEQCDPINVLFDTTQRVDPRSGLPPRLAKPRFDWFDPDKPGTTDPENDRRLAIYDGRFVALLQPGREPLIYGDLRKGGTEFVSWWPFRSHTSAIFLSTDADVGPKWEDPLIPANRINPRFLNYREERHDGDDDPLMLAARAAAERPVFTTNINLSLALRLALRCYLGLEPRSAIGTN
ncbi:hypothetical protein [Bradyrhizobium jicamae]|uniref:hypothetical protein n=1 Tax=Bradyrhizobium jicamae TaxID=280332 RepID=UPI001BACF327|nr:hypothetical protein [Bradyrhizobium jicamae]MBR0938864.1 hypothetical protein [Bradyrhizobium jicamae]